MIGIKRNLLLFMMLWGASPLFAQNAELKTVTDSNWIEYVIPKFMNDITEYDDYVSPHYKRFDYASKDEKS